MAFHLIEYDQPAQICDEMKLFDDKCKEEMGNNGYPVPLKELPCSSYQADIYETSHSNSTKYYFCSQSFRSGVTFLLTTICSSTLGTNFTTTCPLKYDSSSTIASWFARYWRLMRKK